MALQTVVEPFRAYLLPANTAHEARDVVVASRPRNGLLQLLRLTAPHTHLLVFLHVAGTEQHTVEHIRNEDLAVCFEGFRTHSAGDTVRVERAASHLQRRAGDWLLTGGAKYSDEAGVVLRAVELRWLLLLALRRRGRRGRRGRRRSRRGNEMETELLTCFSGVGQATLAAPDALDMEQHTFQAETFEHVLLAHAAPLPESSHEALHAVGLAFLHKVLLVSQQRVALP
mmetsp:Transcript_3140/g.5926  ORF Transcript_3140/g.5926 Transcript_3140/m.5926 type:complete len:228 (+) Transcript_3140:360-1043(+)